MKKWFIGVALTAILFCFALNSALAADKEINIVVNGKTLKLEQPPIMQNGSVFVPMNGVFEHMGIAVFCEPNYINCVTKTKSITFIDINLYGYGRKFENEYLISIDGMRVPGVGRLPNVNDKIMMPTRFIAEVFGAAVSWDSLNSTITITADIAENERWSAEEIAVANAFTQEVALKIADNSPIYRYTERKYDREILFPSYENGAKLYNFAYDGIGETYILQISATEQIVFLTPYNYKTVTADNPQYALAPHAECLPFQEKYDGYLGGVAYLGKQSDIKQFCDKYMFGAWEEKFKEAPIKTVDMDGDDYIFIFPKHVGTAIVISEISMDDNKVYKAGDIIYAGQDAVILRTDIQSEWPKTSIAFTLEKHYVKFGPTSRNLGVYVPKNTQGFGISQYKDWYDILRLPSGQIMNLTVKENDNE